MRKSAQVRWRQVITPLCGSSSLKTFLCGLALSTAITGIGSTANATNYNEGAVTTGTYTYPAGAGHGVNGTCVDTLCTSYSDPYDLSSVGTSPTKIGALTAGDNFITGAITTYGSTYLPDGVTPVGPHGELTNQDQDYVTFSVPSGYELSQFLVSDGTSIITEPRADRVFLGLAAGDSISIPYGPYADSAVGLLGWTLVSQSQLGSDILPEIGSASAAGFPAVPGATGFTGPLGAGTYTLWLYDGDHGASYNFDLVVSSAPEPGAWMLMLAGIGLTGALLRQHRHGTTRTVVS